MLPENKLSHAHGAAAVHFHGLHANDVGGIHGVDVVEPGIGVIGAATPVGAAVEAGQQHRFLQAGGAHESKILRLLPLLEGMGVGLLVDVGEVIHAHFAAGKGLRQFHPRLGRIAVAAGNVRARHCHLGNRPHRLAGQTVQQVDHPFLGGLGHQVQGLAAAAQVDQGGRGAEVAVPEVVMHGLEMPDTLSGIRIQGQQGVAEEVGTLAAGAVEVRGG